MSKVYLGVAEQSRCGKVRSNWGQRERGEVGKWPGRQTLDGVCKIQEQTGGAQT